MEPDGDSGENFDLAARVRVQACRTCVVCRGGRVAVRASPRTTANLPAHGNDPQPPCVLRAPSAAPPHQATNNNYFNQEDAFLFFGRMCSTL